VRAEGVGAKSVHSLEVFTRNTFGEPVASIILHGLGEEGGGLLCPPFEHTGSARRLARTTLSVEGHPPGNWGYKPLILAAIFKLLLERPELNDVLDFKFKEVLDELLWPDNPACRREVEDALDFYSGCSYVRRSVYADGQGIQFSCYLIIWRESWGESRPQSDLCLDGGSSVRIESGLIKALRKGVVAFAGIPFGRLAEARADGLPETPVGAHVHGAQQPRGKTGKDEELAALTFPPPEVRPTVLTRVTPVARRRADSRPKIYSRPVGQIDISIDTGAVARIVLRALTNTASRHPTSSPYVDRKFDGVAEYVFREVDRQIRRIAHILVRRARRRVFEDALRYSHGVMHTMEVKSPGERGRKPTWHSPGQLEEALSRAVRAIEFDGWRPGEQRVVINRRWNVNKVQTATLKLVAAYWSEEEGMSIAQIDSGQMRKWLTSLGLPRFSVLRSRIRKRVQADRVNEPFFELCRGRWWLLALFHSSMISDEEASN
jgi:hypothetical protein